MRPELLQAHPQGRWSSPGAARRSREKTTGSTLGPRGRNGPLGANVVGERHALPRSCTTFSGGRAFTMSCTTTPRNVSSVHCSREHFSTLLADPHRAIDRSWCTKPTTEPTLTAERWFLSVCYRKAKSRWTAGKVGVRAHGGWDHEMHARDLGRTARTDPEQVRKLAGLGLTQKDIASFVGCSQSLISLRFSSSYDLGVTQSKKSMTRH